VFSRVNRRKSVGLVAGCEAFFSTKFREIVAAEFSQTILQAN